MPKTCLHPECNRVQFGGGYCRYHQYLRGKQKRIKPYSNKRVEINKLYNAEADEFRKQNPDCAIKSPVCTQRTQGVHHKKGRGKYLRVKEKWLPACNACNDYCEEHPEWARENGFIESRLY